MLCVNASISFGQGVLAPLSAEFAVAYPALRLHVSFDHAHVALVGDGKTTLTPLSRTSIT